MPKILPRCGLVGLAIVLATIAVAAQARWKVSVSESHASVNGLGGGLIYSCAENASRGAVAVVIRSLRAEGFHTGIIDAGAAGRVRTRWLCAPAGSSSTCFVATSTDVTRIRDLLVRGSRASTTLLDQTVVASLSGSAQAIERVRRSCRAAPEDDLAEQFSSYRRRAQALQSVYGERILRELEQLLLALESLDAEAYSYRWAVYSTTMDEGILSIASLVDEARELQRNARRAGESNLALEMESGITAMETGLLGLREQRAEAEGMYQQAQDLLRQP